VSAPSYAAMRRSVARGTRLLVMDYRPPQYTVVVGQPRPGAVLTVSDAFPSAFHFEHGGRRHGVRWPPAASASVRDEREFWLCLSRGEFLHVRILDAEQETDAQS
jgi:hypothetical protein